MAAPAPPRHMELSLEVPTVSVENLPAIFDTIKHYVVRNTKQINAQQTNPITDGLVVCEYDGLSPLMQITGQQRGAGAAVSVDCAHPLSSAAFRVV